MSQFSGTPFVVVPLYLIQPHDSKPLPANTLITWCWLQHHINKNSAACFPSINTLAEESGISRRGVQRALSHLEGLGAINIEQRQNRSSLYYLNYGKCVTGDAPTATPVTPPKKAKAKKSGGLPSKRGDTHDAPDATLVTRVTPMTPGGDTHDAPLYSELEQEEVNKKKIPLVVPLSVSRIVELYNEVFVPHKRSGKQARGITRGSKMYVRLKKRAQERPTESEWSEMFEAAALIPGCVGATKKFPRGFTLKNFSHASNLDAILNGDFDNWEDREEDGPRSFREQDRITDSVEDLKMKVRSWLRDRLDQGQTDFRVFWDDVRKKIVLGLQARDIAKEEKRVIEITKAMWQEMLTEHRTTSLHTHH